MFVNAIIVGLASQSELSIEEGRMEAFTICLSVDKEVEESIYREYKLLSYVTIGEAAQSKLFYVANFKFLVYCCTTHYYH